MTSALARRITATGPAAEAAVQAVIAEVSSPITVAPYGLAAWLRDAARLQRRPLSAITRIAWGVTIGPATLTLRFHTAGLVAPLQYVLVARRALLGHLLHDGLTVYQAAELFAADPGYLYRMVAGAGAERRAILAAMRAEAPLWAARRFLLPLLHAIPARAWSLERLLSTRIMTKE